VSKVAEFTATEFFRDIRENPVIPAVRAEWKSLERALSGEHAGIFVLGGSIFELARIIEAHGKRPAVFVNVELIGGVAGDKPGVEYLAQHVEGVISTNRHVIEMANSVGLITVQRLFALDLGTTERGLKLIKRAKPDCVEILPALTYPLLVDRHPELRDRPVLGGGLIKDRRDQHAILKAGAIGISTSDERLWKGA
jgi:glycerol uptake operon antiterminator